MVGHNLAAHTLCACKVLLLNARLFLSMRMLPMHHKWSVMRANLISNLSSSRCRLQKKYAVSWTWSQYLGYGVCHRDGPIMFLGGLGREIGEQRSFSDAVVAVCADRDGWINGQPWQL